MNSGMDGWIDSRMADRMNGRMDSKFMDKPKDK